MKSSLICFICLIGSYPLNDAINLRSMSDKLSSSDDQSLYGTYTVMTSAKNGTARKHIQNPVIQNPEDVRFDASDRMEGHIMDFLKHIQPQFKDICVKMFQGKPASFSQGWQDWYIYHNYFKGRKWGDGFYLDIGTNNPLTISNTAFFDKCLGWKGVCVEMNPHHHAAIRERRSCELVDTCVLGNEESVEMNRNGLESSVGRKSTGKNAGTIQCTTFSKIYEKYNISHVDFLSIDIEGAEADTLRCLDLPHYNVSLYLVETNKQDQHQVDLFFQQNGYANSMSFFSPIENKTNKFIDSLYERLPRRRPVLPEAAPCDTSSKRYMSGWCQPFQDDYRPDGHADPWVCTAKKN